MKWSIPEKSLHVDVNTCKKAECYRLSLTKKKTWHAEVLGSELYMVDLMVQQKR